MTQEIKHFCCLISKECGHNSTPERIQEIIDQQKKEEAERWDKFYKENNIEPFSMKEWYKRTGRHE